MITSQDIFVKRYKAATHERLVVHVEWDGLSDADIKVLAERYIVHRLEHELKGSEERLPTAMTVYGLDFLNNDTFVAKPINLPKREVKVKKSKAEKELDKAFAELSPEELAILIGEFNQG